MEKEFVTYEQSLVLKELGFDEHCFGYYSPKGMFIETKVLKQIGFDISAPLYQQAFKWFRNKYKLSGEPQSHQFWFSYNIIYDTLNENICKSVSYGFESYESAELECLKKLIEIVKNK